MPSAGPPMQRCHHLSGDTVDQTLVHDLGKQMMIAIPAPLVVEHHQEHVGVFQLLQQRLAIGALRAGRWDMCLRCGAEDNCVAERAAQAVEDGCLEHEGLEMVRQPIEDFLGQVVDYKAITASKCRDEGSEV